LKGSGSTQEVLEKKKLVEACPMVIQIVTHQKPMKNKNLFAKENRKWIKD